MHMPRSFPGSKYDDQVDSTSQALESLQSMAGTLAFYDGLRGYVAQMRTYELW
jgi:hypothetical protein